MIPDSPAARSSDTAMRDLLRRLERSVIGSHPARPSAPPPPALTLAAPATTVQIGNWALTQDPATGDLIATHTETGTSTTVARRDGA